MKNQIATKMLLYTNTIAFQKWTCRSSWLNRILLLQCFSQWFLVNESYAVCLRFVGNRMIWVCLLRKITATYLNKIDTFVKNLAILKKYNRKWWFENVCCNRWFFNWKKNFSRQLIVKVMLIIWITFMHSLRSTFSLTSVHEKKNWIHKSYTFESSGTTPLPFKPKMSLRRY